MTDCENYRIRMVLQWNMFNYGWFCLAWSCDAIDYVDPRQFRREDGEGCAMPTQNQQQTQTESDTSILVNITQPVSTRNHSWCIWKCLIKRSLTVWYCWDPEVYLETHKCVTLVALLLVSAVQHQWHEVYLAVVVCACDDVGWASSLYNIATAIPVPLVT